MIYNYLYYDIIILVTFKPKNKPFRLGIFNHLKRFDMLLSDHIRAVL